MQTQDSPTWQNDDLTPSWRSRQAIKTIDRSVQSTHFTGCDLSITSPFLMRYRRTKAKKTHPNSEITALGGVTMPFRTAHLSIPFYPKFFGNGKAKSEVSDVWKAIFQRQRTGTANGTQNTQSLQDSDLFPRGSRAHGLRYDTPFGVGCLRM